jgi:hypothetical protein
MLIFALGRPLAHDKHLIIAMSFPLLMAKLLAFAMRQLLGTRQRRHHRHLAAVNLLFFVEGRADAQQTYVCLEPKVLDLGQSYCLPTAICHDLFTEGGSRQKPFAGGLWAFAMCLRHTATSRFP